MARPKKRWEVIRDLIEKNEWLDGVELGVLKGDTLLYLAENCPLVNLTGVDTWQKYSFYPQDRMTGFEKLVMVAAESYANVRILKMDTLQAAKEFEDQSVDYVFIDGDHSYEAVRDEIKAWLPKIRPGGYIMGHDYKHLRFPGVTQAVHERFQDVNELDDYVWAVEV
jgi:SAM-dependent methyltransferase